ncbi:MAG: GSCFA domain-containing protein [Parabacteroides sp.]
MQELYTQITFSKAPFLFSHKEPCILLGSCFVESIGKKLEESKIPTDLNPFGTLYNPASIAQAVRILLRPERFTAKDLFFSNDTYQSFSHHSRFSSPSQDECLKNINERLFSSASSIRNCKRMIITFGTAWVYKLKSNNRIVANCHKLPEKMFDRTRLSVDSIVEEWKELLLSLWEQNPELKILFTVSPIRHWKDGAHNNQLSKATLLLAIEQLQTEFKEQTFYFPAYEIMLDELRDYRFYADDMFHPSALAIEYIWQRFIEKMMTNDSQQIIREWSEIQKAINHKPFQPQSEAYKQFILQTMLKMKRLNDKFPYFDIQFEMDVLNKKIENK